MKSAPFNQPFLDLNDTQWQQLEGGYRGTVYDASPALKALESAKSADEVDEIYQEFWDELHHQGDVGLASYYAVPHLIRIAGQTKVVTANVLGLVSLIEVQRHQNNPSLPTSLAPAYHADIKNLGKLASETLSTEWDLRHASSVLAAIALAKGQLKLANAILNLDSDDVIDEFLESY